MVFSAAGCKRVTLPTASTAFWREYSCAPNDLQRAAQHNPPVCTQRSCTRLQRSPPAFSYDRQRLLALIPAAPCGLRPTTCDGLSGRLRLSAPKMRTTQCSDRTTLMVAIVGSERELPMHLCGCNSTCHGCRVVLRLTVALSTALRNALR